MAAITGANNTLIGNGATVPLGSSNTVILGGSGSTVYMGGAQGGNSGMTVSGGALSLLGSTRLQIHTDAGAVGAALLSGGAGAAPYWSPASIAVTTTPHVMTSPPSALYTMNGTASEFRLIAATAAPRAVIAIKNLLGTSCTITRTDSTIVDVGALTASTGMTLLSGNAASLAGDGTYWYVISKQ